MNVLPALLVALISVSGICAFPTDPEEVPPQCSDPTFACQDLPSARLCGVVKSCIHDIWSTMNAPDDNENVCQICKEMVKEARDQLLSNMTQEEIKEVFEGSCKLLPVKLIADGCIKIVDEFIPELVEMLASRMDPNMVCTVAGLCNAAHLPIHEKSPLSFHPHVSNRGCDRCTKLIFNLKNIASDIPKYEVKHFIEITIRNADPTIDKSSILPTWFKKIGLQDTASVHRHVDSIYTYVTKTMSPKSICGIAGICPMSCQAFSKPKDDLTCEFCTNVLQHVRDLITANTTVEEFRTALLNFCKLTGSFSARCTGLVDKYFDTVFNFIRDMDSHEVCKLIGVCNNGICFQSHTPSIKVVPSFSTPKRIKATKLTPSFPVANADNNPFNPFIKVFPPIVPSKKQNSDESDFSNDIFHSSKNSLPLERFSYPQMAFEKNLECNFCKAISFYLKTDLKNDINKDTIDNALNKVCEKWVMEYPEYCQTFLSKFSSKLVKVLVNVDDFDHLCFHIDACPIEDEKPGLDVRVTKDPSPLCNICKTTCDEIENQLKDPSVKKSVEQTLYQVCNYLPKSITDDCRTFINDNIDNLFNILEQELDGDNLCPALHLCSEDLKVPSMHVKDLECDLCKDFIKQLQEKLQDPEMKQYVKNMLEKACAVLPQDISSQCKDFVDQNIDNLIDILAQDIDPNLVCSALKICPGSMVMKPKKVGGVECDLCKEVITKLDDELKDHATEDAIKDALDKVCSYFPTSFATKCQTFVDQYAESLITILAEEIDPSMVCASLNICPGSIVMKPKPKKIGDLECDLCKEVITKVDDELKDRTTEDAIKDALDKVCSYFPASIATKCQTFVDQYAESLITILAEEMDPAMVCASLNICPAKSELLQKWKTKAQNIECEGCHYVFHYIQGRLMDSASQDEIKTLCKRVCNVLPKEYADNCNAFIDEFGDSLLVLVAQELDPTVMCKKLNACTNASKPPAPKPHIENEKSLKLDECSLCTTVVDYLDKLLEEDDIDKEITGLVEKACSIVPSLKDKCTTLVETYGPYILQMIGQLADSKQVCQEIDMCPRISGHVHLLGGKKCTFGPSYWCQSKLHASACKADSYCKQRVWNK